MSTTAEDRAKVEARIQQVQGEVARYQSLLRSGSAISPEWTKEAINRLLDEVGDPKNQHLKLGGTKYRDTHPYAS